MPHLVLVALGSIAGANARYLIANWAAARFGTAFPYGTLLINLTGSFVLGVAATAIAESFDGNRSASLLVATGFLGAYTTFSTFSFETLALFHQGAARAAITNLLISTLGGVAAALLGISLVLAVR